MVLMVQPLKAACWNHRANRPVDRNQSTYWRSTPLASPGGLILGRSYLHSERELDFRGIERVDFCDRGCLRRGLVLQISLRILVYWDTSAVAPRVHALIVEYLLQSYAGFDSGVPMLKHKGCLQKMNSELSTWFRWYTLNLYFLNSLDWPRTHRSYWPSS